MMWELARPVKLAGILPPGHGVCPQRACGRFESPSSADRGSVMIVLTAAATAAVTLLIVLVARNLSSGEKKINHEVESSWGVDSPQFERVLGSLLGPPIVGGNR